MKKVLSLLLAVVMLFGCTLALASCDLFAPTLKVGYTVYAPMNFYDNDGDVLDGDDGSGDFVGFDTELALLVAEKLGMKVQFAEIDWNNKYSELNSGAIDCIWNGFTSNTKDADGIERADAVRRIDSQRSDGELTALCDFCIENNGDISDYNINRFIEFLKVYPIDLMVGIMKDMKNRKKFVEIALS